MEIETKEKIRVVLADDHLVFVECLAFMIDDTPDITVSFQAHNGAEVLRYLENEHQNTDVILMDISMPVMDGMQACKEIRRLYPDIAVIIMSRHEDGFRVDSCLRSGVKGYLTKDVTSEKVMEAIRRVDGGGAYLSDTVQSTLIDYLRAVKPYRKVLDNLTEHEIQIVRMYAQGKKADEIGQAVHMPTSTVRHHKTHIKKQLTVQSDAELFAKAHEHGLLD